MKSLSKYKNIENLTALLPRHSYSRSGLPMEPISLVIIGNRGEILTSFKKAGWYLAEGINWLSSLQAAVSTVLDSPYRTGPMWSSYINGRRHQLGLERPTQADTYRRRHHLRLWRTGFHLNRRPVWVGTLSYDRSVGFFPGSLLPTHHIGSKLSSEEHFLARTLKIKPIFLKLDKVQTGHINTGDPYLWDGKALVINLASDAA